MFKLILGIGTGLLVIEIMKKCFIMYHRLWIDEQMFDLAKSNDINGLKALLLAKEYLMTKEQVSTLKEHVTMSK